MVLHRNLFFTSLTEATIFPEKEIVGALHTISDNKLPCHYSTAGDFYFLPRKGKSAHCSTDAVCDSPNSVNYRLHVYCESPDGLNYRICISGESPNDVNYRIHISYESPDSINRRIDTSGESPSDVNCWLHASCENVLHVTSFAYCKNNINLLQINLLDHNKK